RQIADFGIFAFGVGLAPHVRSPTSAAIETSTHTRTVRILLAKNLTAPYRRIARLTLRDRGNSQQIQAHKHKPSSIVELHFFFRLLPIRTDFVRTRGARRPHSLHRAVRALGGVSFTKIPCVGQSKS